MSSWGAIYNNAMISLNTHEATLARLQEQVAFGSKIIRASDNPTDAYKVLSLHAYSDSIATYTKNLSNVTSNVYAGSGTLQQIGEFLSTVKQRLTQAATDTYSPDQRAIFPGEVNGILEQIISLINTDDHLGQYFFSGNATTTTPYSSLVENGQIVAVQYQGGFEDLEIPVAPGVNQASAVVGDKIFRCDERSTPLFVSDPSGNGITGVSGVAAGTGTSTVRGDVYMRLAHTTTSFQGGTGVEAGTSSNQGDTILGSHTLTIRVDGGTNYIRLGDGVEVTFAGTETNLELANADGDKAYVDLSGWAGAGSYTGDVSVTSNGKISIDDGDSYTAIDFSANQAITDSETERILYVDGSSVVRTGFEPIRVPGTYDLFGMLINARDLLANTQGLEDQSLLLRKAITSLDEVMAGVSQNMASLGARGNAMETIGDNLADISFNAESQMSTLRDVDIAQIAIDLARTQTFYEMTLASISKVMGMSLLDFI